jgi:putative membrane protein
VDVSPPRRRWPGWVYRSGTDPDPRWSLANERTFLAWIRTALALVSAGVALRLVSPVGHALGQVVETSLLSAGLVAAAGAWPRWARAEKAMRECRPVPTLGLGVVMAAAVVVGVCLLELKARA